MERCRLSYGNFTIMHQLKSYGPVLARWILGGFFIYASLDKLAHPELFARAISNYQLVPFGLENTMAIILPWLELLAGVCLIAGILVDGANLLVAVMLIVFITAISQALGRGIDISCGCFKVTETGRSLGFSTLVQDFILLGLCFWVMNRPDRTLEIYPKPV